jgi:hypothetical protein
VQAVEAPVEVALDHGPLLRRELTVEERLQLAEDLAAVIHG